jgi:hypothetical protein
MKMGALRALAKASALLGVVLVLVATPAANPQTTTTPPFTINSAAPPQKSDADFSKQMQEYGCALNRPPGGWSDPMCQVYFNMQMGVTGATPACTAVTDAWNKFDVNCAKAGTSEDDCIKKAVECKAKVSKVADDKGCDFTVDTIAMQSKGVDDDDDDDDDDDGKKDPMGINRKCENLFPKVCGSSFQASYAAKDAKDLLKDAASDKKDSQQKLKDDQKDIQSAQKDILDAQNNLIKNQDNLENGMRDATNKMNHFLLDQDNAKLASLQKASEYYIEIDKKYVQLRASYKAQQVAVTKAKRDQRVRCDAEARQMQKDIQNKHDLMQAAGTNNTGSLTALNNSKRLLKQNQLRAFRDCMAGEQARQSVGAEQDKLAAMVDGLAQESGILQEQRQNMFKQVMAQQNMAELSKQQATSELAQQMQQLVKNAARTDSQLKQEGQMKSQALAQLQQQYQQDQQESQLVPYRMQCAQNRASCARRAKARPSSSNSDLISLEDLAPQWKALARLCADAINANCTNGLPAGCTTLTTKRSGGSGVDPITESGLMALFSKDDKTFASDVGYKSPRTTASSTSNAAAPSGDRGGAPTTQAAPANPPDTTTPATAPAAAAPATGPAAN